MAEGRFGLPRPLLSESCVISIEDFAAGSAAIAPLERVASDIFKVRDTRVKSDEIYASTPIVILNQNRVTGEEWGTFITEYEQESTSPDIESVVLRPVSLVNSRLPRPLAQSSGIEEIILIEVNFSKVTNSKSEIESLSNSIAEQIQIVESYSRVTDFASIFTLTATGLHAQRMAQIIDVIGGQGVPLSDIVFTCSLREI